MLNVKKTLTKILTRDESILTVDKGTAGQNWCRKNGNIVEFYVESTGISWASGWNTVATLPSGYEPTAYYDFVAKDNTNDTACSCKVTAGGEVQVYKTNALSNAVRIHGMHFAKLGGVIRTLKKLLCISLNERGCAVC